MRIWLVMLALLCAGACATAPPARRGERPTAKNAHRAPSAQETRSATYMEEHIVPRSDVGRFRIYFGSFSRVFEDDEPADSPEEPREDK